MSRSERLLLWSAAVAALALRVLAWLHYRFDSDEQQHLHVAWGWTAGQVQYRDLFDNHTPLFHMLTAPLLALLGERADILLWMRLPMVPLFAFVLWGTFTIARQLYDARVAAWAVVLLALFPPFFLKSLEYRPDNLWNALWIAALVLLLRGRRVFWVGFILGCALAVSVKTMLLLITLGVTGMLWWLFGIGRSHEAFSRPGPIHARRPTAIVLLLSGFAIVPAILVIYFVSAGAWDSLIYCNVTFNSGLALTRKYLWIGRAIFPFTFAAVVWAAWRARRNEHPWRWALAVMVGVFTVTLAGFWPLISPRDFLPMMSIAAIFAAAALTDARRPLLAIGATLVLFCGALYYYADRFENNADWHVTMMEQALRLTHPGERLLDYKGETIYRRRPFYYALEIVTRSQMAAGIIPDTIERDVIRTRTYAAQADGPMWPPAGRAFLLANFVNLGRLRAAGQWLQPDGSFTIAVPGPYVVLDERGLAQGTLDGAPNGIRQLQAGRHQFTGARGACVVWAPAFERGHSPFHLRDRDF
ncbi:MAG: hypothetical protein ABI779_03725 [Acidobacteriota bacterium]